MSGPLITFFNDHLGSNLLLLPDDLTDQATSQHYSDFARLHGFDIPWSSIAPLLADLTRGDSIVTFPTSAERTLVIAHLQANENSVINDSGGAILLTLQDGSCELSQRVVRYTIESWRLTCELATSRLALEDSAIQLAQSFEEQNWLRSFARNASSFSRSVSANQMAIGILQPLGYLLRAQDLFLIVDPAETERSGLSDAKFGQSGFSTGSLRRLLQSLELDPQSPPVVKNNCRLESADGVVTSLIVVQVAARELAVGCLVGINRSAEAHANSLPIYDPEFGSSEVGLLEEAAVLLATQAHNIHLLLQSNQLFIGTLHAMSSAIDARDKYTQGHSERVARLSFELARLYGLSDEACQEIYLAGILHDIGKIGIPDRVLLKDGPLDDAEYAIIKKHPEIGYRIVERLGQLQFVLPGILYHHERWDGRGYPHQLQGNSIPLMARIMAVADAFDAMTSTRPYRSAMSLEKAHGIIRRGAGEQWDAEVVAYFDQWMAAQQSPANTELGSPDSIIPLGSPVELLTQAAMVLGH